jgi:inhibitor of KinA sporulation pathway (predicted exonuclease)
MSSSSSRRKRSGPSPSQGTRAVATNTDISKRARIDLTIDNDNANNDNDNDVKVITTTPTTIMTTSAVAAIPAKVVTGSDGSQSSTLNSNSIDYRSLLTTSAASRRARSSSSSSVSSTSNARTNSKDDKKATTGVAPLSASSSSSSTSSSTQLSPPIIHNTSECPYDYLLVLDFEATCNNDALVPFGPQEVIEFPVILYNTRTLHIDDTFHRYIKPVIHPKLTSFCTKLTGITQTMVDNGTTLQKCLADLHVWMQSHSLLDQHLNIAAPPPPRAKSGSRRPFGNMQWHRGDDNKEGNDSNLIAMRSILDHVSASPITSITKPGFTYTSNRNEQYHDDNDNDNIADECVDDLSIAAAAAADHRTSSSTPSKIEERTREFAALVARSDQHTNSNSNNNDTKLNKLSSRRSIPSDNIADIAAAARIAKGHARAVAPPSLPPPSTSTSSMNHNQSVTSTKRLKRFAWVTHGDWDLKTCLPNQLKLISIPVPSVVTHPSLCIPDMI